MREERERREKIVGKRERKYGLFWNLFGIKRRRVLM